MSYRSAKEGEWHRPSVVLLRRGSEAEDAQIWVTELRHDSLPHLRIDFARRAGEGRAVRLADQADEHLALRSDHRANLAQEVQVFLHWRHEGLLEEQQVRGRILP